MKQLITAPPPWLWKTSLAAALCAAAFSQPSRAQVAPPTILQLEGANAVQYFEDSPDPSKFATDPNVTTPAPPRNFGRNIAISDMVAVNGRRVMGTSTVGVTILRLSPAPVPGQGIADTTRVSAAVINFEILNSDGTLIGTILAEGFYGGAPPPGAPLIGVGSNFVITGGTGAFLGARGQLSSLPNPSGVAGQRNASITEDPANRRRNGGGTIRYVAHLIPLERPEIVRGPEGPSIAHSSDLSLVTASAPATAGEILAVFARGLGPVTPGVDPGQPFPSSPLAAVNSPVEVTVNGKAAEVVSAVGYAGTVDAYQVNFRVPADTAKGPASIQLSAAWISGAPVSIPVQ